MKVTSLRIWVNNSSKRLYYDNKTIPSCLFLLCDSLSDSTDKQDKTIGDEPLPHLSAIRDSGIRQSSHRRTFTGCRYAFADGVGVQANSKIKISLQGKSSLFTCKIGINDQSVNYKDSHLAKIPLTDGTMLFYEQTNGRKQYVGTGKGNGEVEKGSVVFKITGDGKELYNSGIMRGGETARAISLPVEGIKILELEAESAMMDLAVIMLIGWRPSLLISKFDRL